VLNVQAKGVCKEKETMETIMRFNRRGPPPDWKQMAMDLLSCISMEAVQKNEAV
jgi:hypothetical protein